MTAVLSVRPSGSVSTVVFDDGTSFRCTREFARRANIARGQQIDPVLVVRLRESASFDLAMFHAERLTRRGRYSRLEIAQRMRQAGVPGSDGDHALDVLEQRGELDDQIVALSVARRSLKRALSRDPEISWREFRDRHGRRLSLRGFGAGESSAALRQAWFEHEEHEELERSTVALDWEQA